MKWELAKGSCGFNTGDHPVYGAYINGVALFEIAHGAVVITGHMTCSSRLYAEKYAMDHGVSGAYQRYTTRKFRAVMADSCRLA